MADKRLTILLQARDEAGKVVKRLSSRIGGLAKSFAKAGAVAAGAAAAGMAVLVKRQFDVIDSTAKLSAELGISTEALGGYQHAAGLTGTANSTLEKGLQRMVRRLGEAKQGYGEGVKGLEALGLQADAVANKSPEDALLDISDAIKGIKSPTEQAAAAYALFGRQGQEMLNFLKLGADGIRDTRDEADRLGKTFSKLEASKVEQANDAILRMQTAITGIATRIAVAVAPAIRDMANQISEWPWGEMAAQAADALGGVIKLVREATSFVMEFMPSITSVGDFIATIPERINAAMQKVRLRFFELVDVAREVIGFVVSNVMIAAANINLLTTTLISNVIRMAKNMVSNFGPITQNIFDLFKRVATSLPDIFRAAFTDIGTLAEAAFRAISGEGLAAFEGLEFGLAKQVKKAAASLKEPLKEVREKLTAGTTNVANIDFEEFRSFKVSDSSFTKAARNAAALAEQTLATELQKRQEARERGSEADAAGGVPVPGIDGGSGSRSSASGSGSDPFAGLQFSDRFRGLGAMFQIGREPAVQTAENTKRMVFLLEKIAAKEQFERGRERGRQLLAQRTMSAFPT